MQTSQVGRKTSLLSGSYTHIIHYHHDIVQLEFGSEIAYLIAEQEGVP